MVVRGRRALRPHHPGMSRDGRAHNRTEEQSRRNYEVVTQLVNASDPESSRFLLKPLAQVAGGLAHTGGNHWDSTQDPEYQVILDWIRALPAAEFTPADERVAVDFQYYRSCVQPQVLSVGKYGQLPCTSCHAGGQAGFDPVSASGGALTVAEARQGFEVLQRLILPGDPVQSRFLLKPLHPDDGGAYAHNGVRRWRTWGDPEWQTLAAWVRGEVSGSDCSPVTRSQTQSNGSKLRRLKKLTTATPSLLLDYATLSNASTTGANN